MYKSVLDNPLISVLSNISELDNARAPVVSSDAEKYKAFVIKWRWKDDNQDLEIKIKKIIKEFKGKLNWYVSRSDGGSWFLALDKLMVDYNNDQTTDFNKFVDDWSKNNPMICVQAYDELKLLSEFISNRIGQSGTDQH